MSYAEIDASIVREACEKYLQRREARIAQEHEDLIKCKMSSWRNRNKTRDQVIEQLKNAGWSGEWFSILITGSKWSDKVEKLLALSNAKGVDKIMVNAEDAYLLGL